jgi:hypothetical protein
LYAYISPQFNRSRSAFYFQTTHVSVLKPPPRTGADTTSSGDQFSVKKQNPDNRKLTFFSGRGDYAAFMPSHIRPQKSRKTSGKTA